MDRHAKRTTEPSRLSTQLGPLRSQQEQQQQEQQHQKAEGSTQEKQQQQQQQSTLPITPLHPHPQQQQEPQQQLELPPPPLQQQQQQLQPPPQEQGAVAFVGADSPAGPVPTGQSCSPVDGKAPSGKQPFSSRRTSGGLLLPVDWQLPAFEGALLNEVCVGAVRAEEVGASDL